MADLGRRKRSVSLLPRHIAFIEWNGLSQSQIIQEALDDRIRAAGYKPTAVRNGLVSLCGGERTLEAVIGDLDNCASLLNEHQ
jgi:hypothetical protein